MRAQSVLRQKNRGPDENGEQIKAERDQFESDFKSATAKIHQLQLVL